MNCTKRDKCIRKSTYAERRKCTETSCLYNKVSNKRPMKAWSTEGLKKSVSKSS